MPTEKLRHFGIVGGAVFFTILGLANPFFSLHAQALGASTAAIGAMVTLRAILPIFIAMPSGQLIDSIGPVRMLRAAILCLITSLTLVAIAHDMVLLALSQVFLGTAIVIGASSLQVLVAAGDKERRTLGIKRYAMWMSGGSALGPLLGGAVVSLHADPETGYRTAFGLAAAVTACFFVVLTTLRDGGRGMPSGHLGAAVREALSPRGILGSYRSGAGLTRHSAVQFGLTATFINMYIQSMYASFLPLFMDAAGYTALMISITLSAKNLAGMASRFVLGWLMARVQASMILLAAGAVAAMGVTLTPLAAHSAPALLLVVLIIGGAVGLNLPVSIMVMVEAVGEGERGRLMGLRLLANRFAQLVSPAVFGVVGGLIGLSAGFTVAGLLLTATVAGFGLRKMGNPGDATDAAHSHADIGASALVEKG